MIRILHVVTYMGRGGLETMIMNYYRRMDREKVQFDFLVHRNFEADYDQEIKQLGGRIYRLPQLNPFSLGYHRELNRFFKEHPYQIVHSHLDCMSAYPLWHAKRNGVPVRIAHAHNKSQDKNLKYLIKCWSRKFMPAVATHLFACSKDAGDWMFTGAEFRVINNAIDTKHFFYNVQTSKTMKENLGLKNAFVIGHVGRFNTQKNHHFLIDIFAAVNKIHPEAKLLLIGTGSLEKEIYEKVKQFKLEKDVIFLGSRADVSSVLQAVDVFVFPSHYEGLGIAAVEAQTAGIPCILSDQVPLECKIAEDVEFLSLKKSAGEWAEHICRYRHGEKKVMSHSKQVFQYDIEHNADKLQSFYLQEGSR